MADERTEAQRAADDNLEKAITQCAQAYDMLTEGRALGDYLVFLEMQPFAPELSGTTRYGTLLPGGEGIPWHRIWGLHKQLGIELENQTDGDREE